MEAGWQARAGCVGYFLLPLYPGKCIYLGTCGTPTEVQPFPDRRGAEARGSLLVPGLCRGCWIGIWDVPGGIGTALCCRVALGVFFGTPPRRHFISPTVHLHPHPLPSRPGRSHH